MDQMTREALEKSIEHWEANVAAEAPYEASVGGENCALCVAFPTCEGCPVAEWTGEVNCEGTPYYSASRAFTEWSLHDTEEAKALWREAAQKELDFLISLRPD